MVLMSSYSISVESEIEKREIEELLVEIAERPHLLNSSVKREFVDAEVVIEDAE